MLKPARQGTSKHVSAASQDTNASGIADSTISYGESLRLSRFPNPPSSIPTTPISAVFRASPAASPPASLASHRRALPIPSGPATSPLSQNPPGSQYSPTQSPHRRNYDVGTNWHRPPSPSRSLSPHDWHEGASSIDVDTTEDRLLSTSFITSLLQEQSASPGSTRHSAAGSDALSGISEMTYPPQVKNARPHMYSKRNSAVASSSRQPPPRSERGPPSSFIQSAVPPPQEPQIDDDATLLSVTHRSIIRTASLSKGVNAPGATVVGIAPARLQSISRTSRNTTTTTTTTTGDSAANRTSSNREFYEDKLGVPSFQRGHSSIPYSPALPSTAGTQNRFPMDSPLGHQTRASLHSSKSAVSSLLSVAHRNIQRALTRRRKPLPPLPIIPNIPISTERRIRQEDEARPLPELVNRAGALEGMLEKGYNPHHSVRSDSSTYRTPDNYIYEQKFYATGPPDLDGTRNDYNHSVPPPPKPFFSTNRRLVVVLCIFAIIAIVSVSVSVSIALRKNKATPQGSCSGNFTGAACNLDATCVCTSPTSARCDALAQSVIGLIPMMNEVFAMNSSAHDVYNSVWQAQGTPTGLNCGSQSLLLDVAPSLDIRTHPNRTQWAQAALLWNLVESQDPRALASMRAFIKNSNWNILGSSDGPVTSQQSSFSTTASGFTFDFAAQVVSDPPISFVTDGSPTSAQVSRVGPTLGPVLDRMYSFAAAGSTQHQKALSNYWASSLGQRPQDLPLFLAAISASPIVLPFDGTSPPILGMLSNPSLTSFPPPVACYPNLSPTQVQQINTVESQVFNLPSSSSSPLNLTSCSPHHPVYGILNVLRLRTPFLDSRTGLARQAVVLTSGTSPRAVIHSGELLSALPNLPQNPSIQTDPRQFGTTNHLNHVILDYLTSIPDINVATSLVNFVLSSSNVPPPSDSFLYQSLATIPTLEVAVFGAVPPADVNFVQSSLTTPTGGLFFGSDAGNVLRNWTIGDNGRSIAWAELAGSPLVVRDTTMNNYVFNQIWGVVSTALDNKVPVVIGNLTAAFQNNQLLTP